MSETFGAQTFRATAVVTLDEMDHVLATLLDHLEEHATVIRSATGARLTSPFATVDIVRQPEAVHLDVACGSAEILAMIKVFVAEHIFEFATGVPSIVWSGDGSADPFPPHFQKLVVAEAFDVTPRMRRVVFACETVASYGGDASYHVRLLLPPRGRAPVWPSLAADGRMVWPRGEDELVTRVYTIRSVDAGRSRIAVDFVLHEGNHSPGAGFALNAAPGDVIGILGPGGDGCPDAPRLLLMGDEAALPARSRTSHRRRRCDGHGCTGAGPPPPCRIFWKRPLPRASTAAVSPTASSGQAASSGWPRACAKNCAPACRTARAATASTDTGTPAPVGSAIRLRRQHRMNAEHQASHRAGLKALSSWAMQSVHELFRYPNLCFGRCFRVKIGNV
jgi:hypothetical protein